MTSFFFIFKNIFKNICIALFLVTAAFVMIKFLSLEYVLIIATVSFCADAISTRICTKNGFFEKNPLYIVFQKRLDFKKSIVLSGLVYILFLGGMHYLLDIFFEGIMILGIVHAYGSISNTITLFIQKSQMEVSLK